MTRRHNQDSTQQAFEAFLGTRDEPAWLIELAPPGLAAISRNCRGPPAATRSGRAPTSGLFKLDQFALLADTGDRSAPTPTRRC